YIQPRITAAQQNQHPIFKGEIEENFPVALYVGGKKGVVAKTEDGYKYDVYVSYSEKDPDATWVWETLLPQFEQADLKVAVSDDVAELGVARVVNIDRGMQQSRRTLAILSPSYMQNNMAQFENVLGQTMSVEEGRARLFTACLAEIDNSFLPPRLSSDMVGTVNLSDLASRRGKMQLDKLIGAPTCPLGKLM